VSFSGTEYFREDPNDSWPCSFVNFVATQATKKRYQTHCQVNFC
jgi:hypothetical protein